MALSSSTKFPYSVRADEYARYQSRYLAGGYKEDVFALRDIVVTEDSVTARCDITQHFVPSDGVFHFTVPLTFLVVGQVAIVGAHVHSGSAQKAGEVFLLSFEVKCHRPVTKTADIPVRLDLSRRTASRRGIFYRGTLAVDDDGFTGEATFLFPISPGPGESTQ